ncbi:hypothetical protein R5W23_003986 [Gemmata sp. JC673]|uniref:Outer membrane protein assembly factor BamE n=1 Tax=Gemmata algarum TaxID=2975278 RepID=A0ABU5F5D1_9BACT|nr:hypothetical protein [Gemmata algarum]MDY3562520.1 hypothetical protein [Gemmata algarum]
MRRPTRFLRRHPFLVLTALGITFAAWICWDALSPPEPEAVPEVTLRTRLAPTAIVDDAVFPVTTPEGTAQALPRLKTGMSRTEVEGLVGAPTPGNISPATVADGRVVYRTQYETDLAPPATVRPIQRSLPRHPSPSSALVTLEFDATKPGHPLVGIYYPDPLF